MQVLVKTITISGNSRISESELLRALGSATEKPYDFASLSTLASRLTAYYRAAGYPFARAYLPQQDLTKGELRIAVLEGRYGKVVAHGEPGFIDGAQGFLSHLPSGTIMESTALERVTLILDDQPGIRTRPVVRPGQEVGTGDLLFEVQRDHRYKGEVGLDDYGNRYTGRVRTHANLDIDSPFRLGDQIALQTLYTQERMWFGSLAYAAPLGYSGLRGRIGYAHTYYTLGGSFTSLGANGTADVASLGLSYPLVRSLARIQSLTEKVDVYGRASAQWAKGNLDSSEKFGLGGINGVRAYPSGEGYGDSGWLAQVELLYAAGFCVPYLFYDVGNVTLNHTPWGASGDNHRSIAGAGAGVRAAYGAWNSNLVLAWKTHGGAPLSDPHDERPVLWASVQYRF
jgi:hemolysin activation/secretion protein